MLMCKQKYGSDNLSVISFQYPFEKRRYEWNGIRVYSAGGKNRKGLLRLLTWRRVKQQAARWITPDTVIHSFWLTEAAELGANLTRKYKLKHVASIMGQDALLTNNYLQRIDFSDLKVVAPNKKSAGYFNMHTGLDVHAIIPHTITPPPFEHLERDIDLLFAGAFSELKQPHIFIQVVKNLLQSGLKVSATMIGEGELFEDVKNIATTQNLPITFCGKISRKDVYMCMNRSRILLHTSRYEGHSTVISEALASGCKVVCFDVGKTDNESIHVTHDKNEMTDVVKTILETKNIYEPNYKDSPESALILYNDLYTN